jgi:hypothetical protein
MCYEIPVRQILEARISSPFKAGVRPFQLQAAELREHTGLHICELDQKILPICCIQDAPV